MKKIKRFLALSLASVMLLGMTLTVNAAPASPRCNTCYADSMFVDHVKTTYEYGQIFYHWKCTWCKSEWRSRVN